MSDKVGLPRLPPPLPFRFSVRYAVYMLCYRPATVRRDVRLVTIGGKMVGTQVAIIISRLEVVKALHMA